LADSEGIITWFSVPTKAWLFETPDQLVVPKTAFCWSENPVEGAGQATTTVFVELSTTRNSGAPGVWTATMLQNPPSRLKPPPLMGPASDWPIVLLTE
jgi:hypothetical protein